MKATFTNASRSNSAMSIKASPKPTKSSKILFSTRAARISPSSSTPPWPSKIPTASSPLDQHANSPLPPPRSRQSSANAASAHSRHRHAQRRRLRRQERSLQSRNCGGQSRATSRSPCKNLPHARRSFLLPSRPPSCFDEFQNGREKRRHYHRHAFANANRRRRLRLLRRSQHSLHRSAANHYVPRSALSFPRLPHLHQQAPVRTQARPRHRAAAFRPGSAARQNRREAPNRSRRPASAHCRVFQRRPPNFLPPHPGTSFPLHSPRGELFRLAREIPQAARRPRRRPGLLRLSHRRRSPHLLERNAALRRATKIRSRRRRHT